MPHPILAIAKGADWVLGLTIRAAAVVSAGAIFLMAVLMAANVIARQMFDSPFLDTVLLGELSVVVLTYLGLAWVYRLGRHVSVRVLVDRFAWRRRVSIELVFLTLSLIGLFVAIYETWGFAYSGLQLGERLRGIWRVDAFPFHVLMPVGLALLSLEVARGIVLGVAALVRDRPDLVVDEQRAGQDV